MQEFIVKFTKYRYHNEQVRLLENLLHMEHRWKVVDRENAALAFPTDFELIRVF